MDKRESVYRDKDGVLVLDNTVYESDDDWIRAARLKKRADAGDEEAAKEFERMEHNKSIGTIQPEEEEP